MEYCTLLEMPYATGILKLSNNVVLIRKMNFKAFTTTASQSVQGTLNLGYLLQERSKSHSLEVYRACGFVGPILTSQYV